MKHLFWVCWGAEIIAVLFWIAKEMSLRYNPDPLSYYIGLYLMIVLACRFAFDLQKVSTMLVALPAIPLFAIASLFTLAPYREVRLRK